MCYRVHQNPPQNLNFRKLCLESTYSSSVSLKSASVLFTHLTQHLLNFCFIQLLRLIRLLCMLNTPPITIPCLHSVRGSWCTSIQILAVLLLFHCNCHLQVVVVFVVTTKLICLYLLSLGGRFATFRKVQRYQKNLKVKTLLKYTGFIRNEGKNTHPTTYNRILEDLKPTNNLGTLYIRSEYERWCMNFLRMAQMCRNKQEQ